MHTIRSSSSRDKVVREIVMVIHAGSVAGGRDMGGQGRIGTEHLDGLQYGKTENLEATLLKFCHLGIGPGINDNIGHDVVCL
jgi:hypothetical protein